MRGGGQEYPDVWLNGHVALIQEVPQFTSPPSADGDADVCRSVSVFEHVRVCVRARENNRLFNEWWRFGSH